MHVLRPGEAERQQLCSHPSREWTPCPGHSPWHRATLAGKLSFLFPTLGERGQQPAQCWWVEAPATHQARLVDPLASASQPNRDHYFLPLSPLLRIWAHLIRPNKLLLGVGTGPLGKKLERDRCALFSESAVQ